MRIAYVASVAAALTLAFSWGASAEGRSTSACAHDLSGDGRPVAISSELSDPDRVAISVSINEALRGPTGATDWPNAQLKAAPACVLAAFEAGGETYVLSGGVGLLPPRWVHTEAGDVGFFLAEGREGGPPIPQAPNGHPFFLIGLATDQRFVLTMYDGAPSDANLKTDIAAALKPGFTPLASYDPDSGAVSIFRNTKSGIGAQLFGPAPDPEHQATIYAPDGRYFVPDNKLDSRMRGSGLPCPSDLGTVARRKMVIVNGDDEKLDLACLYYGETAKVSVFATRADGNPLSDLFRSNVKDARTDNPGARSIERLAPVGGKGQFAFGEAWRGKTNISSGLWLGERAGYRIEVRADWTTAGVQSARTALGILQALAFEKNLFNTQ
jgi:hypothetical protein